MTWAKSWHTPRPVSRTSSKGVAIVVDPLRYSKVRWMRALSAAIADASGWPGTKVSSASACALSESGARSEGSEPAVMLRTSSGDGCVPSPGRPPVRTARTSAATWSHASWGSVAAATWGRSTETIECETTWRTVWGSVAWNQASRLPAKSSWLRLSRGSGVTSRCERWITCSLVRRGSSMAVSYTHLRAHETRHDLVCRLLLEKKKKNITYKQKKTKIKNNKKTKKK